MPSRLQQYKRDMSVLGISVGGAAINLYFLIALVLWKKW